VLILGQVERDERFWGRVEKDHERLLVQHRIDQGHAMELLKVHDRAGDRRGVAHINTELIQAVFQALAAIHWLISGLLELLKRHEVRQ